MARYVEPTKEQEREWKKWVKARPAHVRAVAEQFEPWSLYRIKSTNQRVTIGSFSETKEGRVTLTVNVLAEFNLISHERAVFGIDPNDLEPCDLPDPDEKLGAMLSAKEVEENIHAMRVMVRPDLWVMGDDGIAVRRH